MAQANHLSAEERVEATYRNDLIKSPFYGILEAGWTGLVLLVAIRYFDAPDSYKSFIAGASPIGFLLTPLTLYFVTRWKCRPSLVPAVLFILCAIWIVGASVTESLIIFTVLMIMSQVVAMQQGPLMTQIYAENYPASQRGSRVSIPFMLTSISTVLFSLIGGWLLDQSLDYYRQLLWVMALAALAYSSAINRIPSTAFSTDAVGNLWNSLSLIWKDRLFGYLLGSWMLLGLGNLITVPIRVEYLANPDYGINLDNTSIALILVIVPAVARILSTQLWGRLFDKLHLITLRTLLNTFFLLGIGCFFFTENRVVLAIAMTFAGLAMGGGRIIWHLWVTKIAPPEKSSAYMSVHVALTGVRGTIAPFVGYWILRESTPQGVALSGMALIAISTLLFELLRSNERFGD